MVAWISVCVRFTVIGVERGMTFVGVGSMEGKYFQGSRLHGPDDVLLHGSVRESYSFHQLP